MMNPVKPPVKPVQGKPLILGVLGALLLVVGLVFWIGLSGGSTHVPPSRPGVGFGLDDAGAGPASTGPPKNDEAPGAAADAGAVDKTIHDSGRHDGDERDARR